MIKREAVWVVLWLAGVGAVIYGVTPYVKEAWENLQPIAISPEVENDIAKDTSKVVVGRWDKEQAFNGYTLVTSRWPVSIQLVDMEGNTLHRWRLPGKEIVKNDVTHNKQKAKLFLSGAYLFPNGDIVVELWLSGATPYGYKLVRLDKDSRILWQYYGKTHHEVSVSSDKKRIFTAAHDFEPTPPWLKIESQKVLNDYIVTLSPEGKELEKINILDTFKDTKFVNLIQPQNRKTWDLTHTNSVTVLEAGIADRFPQFKVGSFLISMRNISTLAVIDPDTHKVVWAAQGPWYRQHSAHFTKNGHIMFFDNLGLSRENPSNTIARIIELNPNNNEIVWEYPKSGQESYKTKLKGRIQILENENILITYHSKKLLEITRKGDPVWEGRAMAKQGRRVKGKMVINGIRYTPEEIAFISKTE